MMANGMSRFGAVLLFCFNLNIILKIHAIGLRHDDSRYLTKSKSCQQICLKFHVENGCQPIPVNTTLKEVIVITNGSADIVSWKWDTITMVISSDATALSDVQRVACITHSKGLPYGLIVPVPGTLPDNGQDVKDVVAAFTNKLVSDKMKFHIDHIVLNLLKFFTSLELENNKSMVAAKVNFMSSFVKQSKNILAPIEGNEMYCIVPWIPLCYGNCRSLRSLMSSCDLLLLSPDSFRPLPDEDGVCTASATMPMSSYRYGLERYNLFFHSPQKIVAGIPWHGYKYTCDILNEQTGKCTLNGTTGERCFNASNRQRMSLRHIYLSDITYFDVKKDVFTGAVFYNSHIGNTTQVWFEDMSTLTEKYKLAKDLNLKGVSLWEGEDLDYGLNPAGGRTFSMHQWDFLTHSALHSIVQSPSMDKHHTADTVAVVGVGCLLLGTLLGVLFTCIAVRRREFRKRFRPFRLDETQNEYRDDGF